MRNLDIGKIDPRRMGQRKREECNPELLETASGHESLVAVKGFLVASNYLNSVSHNIGSSVTGNVSRQGNFKGL